MDKYRQLKDSSRGFTECNASCMGVNSEGTKAILAGRRGFLLVDLEDSSLGYKRTIHNYKWEPSVLEWNPSHYNSDLFAMVLNQKVEIWSCNNVSDSPRTVLGRHTRVVSDLNWKSSLTESSSTILLTCSMDTSIHLWDLREHRRPMQTFTTVAGPSQVKWNHKNEYIFASAHDGDVRVWDTRKGNIPLVYIAGHLSKINGLDWSPNNESCFVTASNDKTVKFWNINTPKQAKGTLSSESPVWRARYTPFGDGLLTVVVPTLRRDENNLLLWNCFDLTLPVHTFTGHQDVILEFQWRIRSFKGQVEYQLVTWAKDQQLKLWALSPKLAKKPIEIEARKLLDDEHDATLPILRSGVSNNSHEESAKSNERSRDKYQLQNELQKEFDLININNPIVSFELLDAKQRVCAVSAKIGPHMVKVHISFPILYPNNIPPHFKFSKDTNVGPDVKSRFMKALLDTSNSHVKYNRTCLEPCVRQLVQQIEELSLRDELFETIPSSPPSLPSFFPRRLNTNSFGSYQDPAVPFPRFSGARFCGVDKLILFTRPAKFSHVNSEGTEITLRSMSALPAFISNMNVEESFHTSAFEKDVSTNGIRQKSSGSVVISDVSALVPIHKTIARESVIGGNDMNEICRVNANAAMMVGRADLVRAWSLVAMVMDKQLQANDNFDEAPWANHPFGRRLIQSLFKYYSEIRDVQTLALLSCALSKQQLPSNLPTSPVRFRRGYTIGTSFLSDTSHAVKRARVIPSDNLPQMSPDFPYGMFRTSSTSSATGSMSPPTFILERSESLEEIKFEYSRSCRLLDPAHSRQYDSFKKAYSDILYRWNLLTKRAEVLKFVSDVSMPHRGLGLLNFCVACGHGGHTLHMMEWFEKMETCATGCGCCCLRNGSIVSEDDGFGYHR
eukprot:gene18843-20739_t